MENIEILLVEDNPSDGVILKDALTEMGYTVSFLATKLGEGIDYFMNHPIDFVILDIYLNGAPDGIRMARIIRESKERSCPFLFLTSANDKDTFNQAKLTLPHSYLIKPFNQLELQYAIELALQQEARSDHQFDWEKTDGSVLINKTFFIKKREKLVKVRDTEILYIEVEGRYCKLSSSRESFLVQSSLTAILEKLDQKIFARTHRNYAVNLEKVKEVRPTDQLITMENEVTVFLSETYKQDFFGRYSILK